MSHTFVNDPKFLELPPGSYPVELSSIEDRKPFENARYGNDGEPRLGWRFRLLSGPHQGQVFEQGTGSEMGGPKSKLTQLLTMLLGRKIAQSEKVDGDQFVGCRYLMTLQVNPDSQKGRCHIVALTPLAAAEVGGGEAPPPPPLPPPKRPATPAASEGAEFWVNVGEGQPPVKKSRSALEEYIRECGIDVGVLQVQEVGKATGWVPASQVGFEGPIPF
jgi:hypothetical protein